MTRVLITGGGILGTFHAMEALARGFEVTQFEASAEPEASTPRSPGVLHFSRCAPGMGLELGIRAAHGWTSLSEQTDNTLLRRTGSSVVAVDDQQAETLAALASRHDATGRGWTLTDGDAARETRPMFSETVRASLDSSLDIVVEPRSMLEALRTVMLANDRYTYKGGVDIRDVGQGVLTDATGRTHRGDFSVLCPGSRSDLTVSLMRQPTKLRSMRIQVAQTERLERVLGAPFSDFSALAGSDLGRATGMQLPPADPRLGSTEVLLTCVQRRNRSLTIGETRDCEEPFGFEVSQRPIETLIDRLRGILGADPPAIAHQWVGHVRTCTDGRLWLRDDLDEVTTLVTSAGQRGIMLAPVIASDTLDWLIDGVDSGATHPGADGGPAN